MAIETQRQPALSVVIPVYRSAESLSELAERLENTIRGMDLTAEIIMVDDRSPDNAWDVIGALSARHPMLKGVRLSRNFGQHRAITAGLSLARGEWIAVMDCDLQDRPEELPRLFEETRSGYDVVLASRSGRHDHAMKKASGWFFYRTLELLTSYDFDHTIANFGIYHSKVIRAVLSLREQTQYFPIMVKWVGFKTAKVEVEHADRKFGRTSYTISKLFRLALEIVLAHSNRPLYAVATFGLLISAGAFFTGLYFFVLAVFHRFQVSGWASLIISIWLFSGLIIFVLGILGMYLGRVFEQTKDRPLFILDETTK